MSNTIINTNDVVVCNCCSCGDELLGWSMRTKIKFFTQEQLNRWTKFLYIRIQGRPWCQECYELHGCFLTGEHYQCLSAN